MNEQDLVFLVWNVRSLNDDDRKTTVSWTIASSSCHIACLQESKLQNIYAATAAIIGGFRLKGFAHRSAVGTKGSILVFFFSVME
jgi:exonuclease III